MKKILLIIVGLALVFATPVYGATENEESKTLFGQVKNIFGEVFDGKDVPEKANEAVKNIEGNFDENQELRQTRDRKKDGSLISSDDVKGEINETGRAIKGNTAPTPINANIKSETNSGNSVGYERNTRSVIAGTNFEFILVENASTGHLWKLEEKDADIYKLIDSVYKSIDNGVTDEETTNVRVGAPGKRIFKFKALEEGKDTIKFNLISPAGEKVEIKEVDLKVINSDDAGETIEMKKPGIFNSIKRGFDKITGNDDNKEKSMGPGEFSPAENANISEEVREFITKKREEVRNKIMTNKEEVNEIREKAYERVQNKKMEMKEDFEMIKNENKREIAKRVHNRIFEIKDNVLVRFDKNLDKIKSVLTNISTRADKAEAEGIDVSEIKSEIENIEEKINDLRENIKNNFDIDYSVEFDNEEEVKEKLEEAKNNLHNNLEELREKIKVIHNMTRSAAEKLNEALINN